MTLERPVDRDWRYSMRGKSGVGGYRKSGVVRLV